MKTRHSSIETRPCGQRGVSLLFALLALAALALAAVGLVRTVGTGSLAVGNLAFKLDTTASADRGAELAIAWLQTNVAALDSDSAGNGYYANALVALDPTGRNTAAAIRAVVDWDDGYPTDGNCSTAVGTITACIRPHAAQTVGTNSVSWVITRLCAAAGSATAAGNTCAATITSGVSDCDDKSDKNYNTPCIEKVIPPAPYYRIVVRADGARNTVSYTETIVHF